MGASDYPAGDLRVSDADRDRALAQLSEHFQAGRLTAEELDERSGRALRARAGEELAGLLADLPRDQPPPVPSAAVSRSGTRLPGRAPAARIGIAAAAVVVVTAVLAGSHGGHHGLLALVPVLAVLLVLRHLARRRRHDRDRE